MIGAHSVVAYSDPNAAGWGSPLFNNAYFDNDMSGWATGPFSPAWSWIAGGSLTMTSPNGTGSQLIRTTAGTVARPPNVALYRLRCEITVSTRCNLFLKIHFGTTQLGAAQGPVWRPNESVERWTGATVQAGTTVVELTISQATNVPGPEYVWIGPSLGIYPTPDQTTPFTCQVSSFIVDYRSSGGSVDLSCIVDQISIAHGREDSTGQPEASSATIDITATRAAPLPAIVDIGSVIVVSTLTPEGSSTRFTGRVTDIALGWDEAAEDTPDEGVGQIIAVSPLADLARRVVGAEPWPVELDGPRVARVADLAGMPLDARWSDPGTVSIVARDVDAQPALDVMHGVAESAGGIVWNTRNGDVRYSDAAHRRGVPVSLVLDACDVLVTPRWLRNLAGLVNDISIGYGVEPEDGGEQPRYTASDAASIAKYGRYALSVATELAALADAQAMGQLVIVRNSSPAWNMAALPVDVAGLSQKETTSLLGLDMHALVTLTGLPAIGTAPTSVNLWVEGWRETLANGEHELELFITDYCRTSPPPRWNDVSPNWTWDDAPTSLTWDGAACLGPPADYGRWDDVSASLRWDQLAPAMTWDTYETATSGG